MLSKKPSNHINLRFILNQYRSFIDNFLKIKLKIPKIYYYYNFFVFLTWSSSVHKNIHIYTENSNRLLFISSSLKSYNSNGVSFSNRTEINRNRQV